MSDLPDEDLKKMKEMRDAWMERVILSTQPKWKDVQTKSIEEIKKSLPDVDAETKEWIVREVLLTLRCHFCERARSDACNFSVCVRGLMSGIEPEGGV
ncbi:MAG: hypothetical protein JSW28_10215 [Thermoplasmata archaeon]|nr:MAG: hypothetical protein JSW28_10215 [Thermoplasmata archaeon]